MAKFFTVPSVSIAIPLSVPKMKVYEQIARQQMGTFSVLTAWVGCISYAFQIYFDFSGYSDMAIGLGKMFGFEFRKNFDYPYISTSITEFWRRWHISLSTWFREYVYIPLGGNRCNQSRHYSSLCSSSQLPNCQRFGMKMEEDTTNVKNVYMVTRWQEFM